MVWKAPLLLEILSLNSSNRVLTISHPGLPFFIHWSLSVRGSPLPFSPLALPPPHFSCDTFVDWLVCPEHVSQSPGESTKLMAGFQLQSF